MRNNFTNPEMNISLFNLENVVTASGETNLDEAQQALTAKGATEGNITTITLDSLGFTF